MIREQDKNIYKPYLTAINFAIEQFIKTNGTKPVLLDAGCGHSTVLANEYKKCKEIIGVDLDEAGLNKNELVDKRIVSDITKIPLADKCIDIIVSAWVLEHIAEPEVFIKEIVRLLRPDGYFIFITPNKNSIPGFLNRIIPLSIKDKLAKLFYGRQEGDTFPTVYKLNTRSDILKYTEPCDLRKVKLIYNDDISYLGFNFLTKTLAYIWHRIVMTKSFTSVRANIIGIYQKL